MDTIFSENAKTVTVKQGKNPRHLYPHQVEAITALDAVNKKDSFNSLLVLPTGAGKTMTSSTWLLRTALDNKKKVLWIAHRHLLLEQAADSFTVNAYSDNLLNCTSFKYRIVSGKHDRATKIKPDDDILIIGKDSLVRNMHTLDEWLNGVDELYFTIDEAHHATARSYRRIIEYLQNKVEKVKLLGLTATPFRTSEQEKGLLGQIFTDDVVYKKDLTDLIKAGILSMPICESCDTSIPLGKELGLGAIKSIEKLDLIPEDIAANIAENKERNAFIIKTYFENDNHKKFGQTLVFALNRIHAITLKALFEEHGKKLGIKAGIIISGTKAEFTGIDVSNEENDRQINAYRNGEIQILINVNILTEGVDLPKTQTVFLTRPTISTVLMTQMIGRALRGEKAGGTKEAYIVSFVDDWNNKIAWLNPESIITAEANEFVDTEHEHKQRTIRLISIEKIEEFARVANNTVDTTRLESLEFIKRVPIGMYSFRFTDENDMEHDHLILVYDNSEQRYKEFISALPAIFNDFGVDEEVIESNTLATMIRQCEHAYFDGDMIPAYNRRDIEYLLKFFAHNLIEPPFIPIDKADRDKLNIEHIAKEIIDKDMRPSEEEIYIDDLWNDETNLLRVFYDNIIFLADCFISKS